jgi:hypothetical protein
MKNMMLRFAAMLAFIGCFMVDTPVQSTPTDSSMALVDCCSRRVTSITVQRFTNNKFKLLLSGSTSGPGGCPLAYNYIWSVTPGTNYTVTNYNNGFAVIDLVPASYPIGTMINVCLSLQYPGCAPTTPFCVPFTI